jgi:hypothetical protein
MKLKLSAKLCACALLGPLAALMIAPVIIAPVLAHDNDALVALAREPDTFVALARGNDTFVALTRDSGQWADAPARVRQWFQSLMQPDQPYVSCCGEADAYEADTFEVEGDHYVAIITDGKGVIAEGTRIPVPNNKIKFDAGNPTGHGIVFIGPAAQVYCYVAPSGA